MDIEGIDVCGCQCVVRAVCPPRIFALRKHKV